VDLHILHALASRQSFLQKNLHYVFGNGTSPRQMSFRTKAEGESRMRYNALLTIAFLSLLSISLGALADMPASASAPAASQPTRAQIVAWLQAAEKTCAAADPNDPQWKKRDLILSRISWSYAVIGDANKAKAIVSLVSENSRLVNSIPIWLTKGGYVDEAVAMARDANNPYLLSRVARVSAQKNPAKALAIARQVQKEYLSSVYVYIVQQQVLQGDVKGAEKTAELVTETEEKLEARRWVQAGTLAQANGDLVKAAAERNLKISELSAELAKIAEREAEKGDMAGAERVVVVLPTPETRASGLLALAEYQLDHSSKDRALANMLQAEKETDSIAEDAESVSFMTKAVNYMELAVLYVKAGQPNQCDNLMEKYRKAAQKDSLGVIKGLGGDAAEVSLYIQAGKLEDAARIASKPNGELPAEVTSALAEAYASRGQTAQAQKLLKQGRSTQAQEAELYVAAAEWGVRKMFFPKEP
jgi:hypothetical protein